MTQSTQTDRRDRPRIALVLPGGGARSAYQVGVLHAIAGWYPPKATLPFAVLCGTSAGAINAAVLAAHAGDLRQATAALVRVWGGFRIEQVFRAGATDMLRSGLHLFLALAHGWLAAAGAARAIQQRAAAGIAREERDIRGPAECARIGHDGLCRNHGDLAHGR